jgi:predicted DsbA family dithiol-disulfide isomerase
LFKNKKNMTVEIWSDIACPFCYIGKRRFEAALSQYEGKENIEIIWRSFQLDPSLVSEPNKSVAQSLCEKKGWSMAQTKQIMSNVVEMAHSVGLEFDFDRAIVANTYDAHRLIHFAHVQGKQDAAKEALLSAYFKDGKDIASPQILAEIATNIGLNKEETLEMLASDAYKTDFEEDIDTARQFQISGVPFFVFDRKYAISGAQEVEVFLSALQKGTSR